MRRGLKAAEECLDRLKKARNACLKEVLKWEVSERANTYGPGTWVYLLMM